MKRTVAAAIFLTFAVLPASSTSPHAQTAAGAQSARQRCLALAGMRIPSASIGLPTSGATIVSTSLEAATAPGNTNGEFCKVLGSIHPVDPTAPDIKFEVNLPSRWNSRVLQMGGGGFDGVLVTGLTGASNQVPDAPTPLASGYVTVGSDSGHEAAGAFNGTFALNAEAFANFGRLQVKKVHDVTMALVKARYGTSPKHSYFIGGSQGGHEALIAALYYPADYDGIVAHYPAYDITLMHLGALNQVKAVYSSPGAWISPAKVKNLVAAVYAACDHLDGARDGIIGNVAGCNKAFTIDTVRQTMRCADGRDAGDSCLSDAQLGAVDAINRPYSLSFPTMAGLTTYPKWPILDGATFLANNLGSTPTPSPIPAAADAFQYRVAAGTVRYVITQDPTYDVLSFDPDKWARRITEVSEIWDANSVDFSQFAGKGGKVILTVGTIDDSISPYNTVNYYERLVTRFGQATADRFVRFYRIPGFGHGNGVFNAKFDALGALDRWVDQGHAPATLEAVDANPANNQRRRPMCVYPAWPRYTGTGDIDAASSFSCVIDEGSAPQTR